MIGVVSSSSRVDEQQAQVRRTPHSDSDVGFLFKTGLFTSLSERAFSGCRFSTTTVQVARAGPRTPSSSVTGQPHLNPVTWSLHSYPNVTFYPNLRFVSLPSKTASSWCLPEQPDRRGGGRPAPAGVKTVACILLKISRFAPPCTPAVVGHHRFLGILA